MKRTLCLFLLTLLLLSACSAGVVSGGQDGPAEVITKEDTQPEAPGGTFTNFRAGALKGPTAMGMVRMMASDGLDTYTLAASADELSPSLIKGELDIACVPANLAAVLYNRTEGGIVVLAVNTLGVLYIVENGSAVHSLEDLRGRSLVAAGKGSTPEYGLRYLLQENGLNPDSDVTIDWKSEHSECVAALASGAADLALLPQPFVTVAQGKIEGLRTALDLTAEWDALNNGSAMITGVAAARRDFVESNPEAVDRFLKEYAQSVEWVNTHTEDAAALIGEFGIVEAAVAEKALPYCNIVCITGQELENKLTGYLQALYDAAPDSVGGAMPGDGFCYVR